jgi:CheY-like chemotaxis protein
MNDSEQPEDLEQHEDPKRTDDRALRAMKNAAESQTRPSGEQTDPPLRVVPDDAMTIPGIASGIHRLDERLGGLEQGGVYLFAGPPGPSKMVAALQFLHQGVSGGERGLLLSSSEAEEILDVAGAWGFDLDTAWKEDCLEVIGFRDDFEMRVLRSTEPEDALEELGQLADPEITRIAVDPGSLFLQGGTRTLLGRTFLEWARRHSATVVATLSVDSHGSLPAAAEWLVQATSGVFLFEKRQDGLQQISLQRAIPGAAGSEDPITLQLIPGKGLTAPDRFPTRRRSDRPAGEANRVLLLSLVEPGTSDLEGWVRSTFRAEVVATPLDALAALRGGAAFGGVLIHSPRRRIREAAQACRAIRPLTGAAVVVASDEAIRSSDRVTFLEAGADDCLTGGVDFRELGARLDQAVKTGGKPHGHTDAVRAVPAALQGGVVDPAFLASEAARRSQDPSASVFTLVAIGSGPDQAEELLEIVADEIRREEGDLAARGPDGCVVLLQGTRRGPAGAFLARVRSAVELRLGGDRAMLFQVATNPADHDQVESLLSRFEADSGDRQPTAGPGGSDDPRA